MKRRYLFGAGLIALAILVTLIVWQQSFDFGEFGPANAQQTFVLWAVSTLIFLLTVTLGFMLFREGAKLYVARRRNVEGSRIRTKLVIGALALSIIPVCFLVAFSIQVLNRNLAKWFSSPAERIQQDVVEVSVAFNTETLRRAQAQADLLALSPDLGAFLATGVKAADFPGKLCEDGSLAEVSVRRTEGRTIQVCSSAPPRAGPNKTVTVEKELPMGTLVLRARMAVDLAAKQANIEREVAEYNKLNSARKEVTWSYNLMLLLISLFILFVAIWIALFLAKQISQPISALVEAAGQLRQGNFSYRIRTEAIDELGTLVSAFNEMAAGLEASEKELEDRRNFTEAILESIPTGVISLSPARRIQRCNRALVQMFGVERVANATRLEDLFPLEDVREIHYLLNRASRTGIAGSQLEFKYDRQTLHLAVTVSALIGKHTSGWVMVLEDTSELLRAQKTLAWHEVARRVAHELKNPLTPIALSAGRIGRQIEKLAAGGAVHQLPGDVLRILRECSLTISAEVESVKTLVDEFSQFARFPAAQPVPADLNDVVDSGLAVFLGRLQGIELRRALAPNLPDVLIDREQIKRVVVNLVDNAAEAMSETPEKVLTVTTQLAGPDSIELVVADSGCGISAEDRERLFLPYFSTKGRGTGLGLAIVHHILNDHGAQVRVEENRPRGARFVIEFPAASHGAEPMPKTIESVV